MRRRTKHMMGGIALLLSTLVGMYTITAGQNRFVAPSIRAAAAPRSAISIDLNPPAPAHNAPDSVDVDPFAPRGWHAASAPPVQAPVPVALAAPAAPIQSVAPTTPPTLPFKFIGRLSDAGQELMYIGRGEESWTVKGGETLDSNFKVVSVDPQQIVFEHIPTGTQLTLAIPETDK